MVSWWKNKESVQAKVTKAPEGHYVMQMEGEPYPFPGFPRGYLLYGELSKLKHNIKNKIFNDAHAMLEAGKSREDVIQSIKGPILDEIVAMGHELRYEFVPETQLNPPVKEIYRAWTEAEKFIRPDKRAKMAMLKEVLCLILQEDDAYRFRVQWLTNYFPKKHYKIAFNIALKMMEHAEVVDDMKERIRLLRRILNLVLEDEVIGTLFDAFVKEVNWKKVQLTKIDKYFFRAKYFKVDYSRYDY